MSKYIGRTIPLFNHLVDYFNNGSSGYFRDWQLTFMGRDAIKAIKYSFDLRDRNVLIPSYSCIEAIYPLLSSNLNFYEISTPN